MPLSTEAVRLSSKIAKEWSIRDSAGKLLLQTAMECLDAMRAAQQVLAHEGVITLDRFKQPKLHPAAQREKESRAHLLAALKALNLDLESIEEDGDDAKET